MTDRTKQDSAAVARVDLHDLLRTRLGSVPCIGLEPERTPQAAVTLLLWERPTDLDLLDELGGRLESLGRWPDLIDVRRKRIAALEGGVGAIATQWPMRAG